MMSDITIATASQSPTQTPGAAGNNDKAGGSQDFLELLRGSSAHHLAKGSLIFAQGQTVDTSFRPTKTEGDDLDRLPTDTARTESDTPKAEKNEPVEEPQEEHAARNVEPEQSPEESAAVREGNRAQQNDTKAAERQPDAAARADTTGKPAAGREAAAPPNNEAPEVLVPAGKDSAKATQSGQAAAAVERAGLVSKPQQTLAQAATAAGETARKVAQPTQAATEGSEVPSVRTADPRATQEPAIQRPTPSIQPGAQSAANASGVPGGNAANAGVFAAAVTEAAAPRSGNASPAATAASNAQVATAPKAATSAMPVTAGTGEPVPLKDTPRSTPANFANQLRGNAETVQQLSQHLSRAAALGKDRISLQLNPSELGRVDIKLEFGQDQSMRAVISADRPETLDLLQRDARALERALQDAGVKLDNNALNFAHREDQQAGGQLNQGSAETSSTAASEAGEQDGDVEISTQSQARTSAWQGAVNIEV